MSEVHQLARKISICNCDNSDSIMTIVKRSVVVVNADANAILPQISQSISSEKSTKGAKHDFTRRQHHHLVCDSSAQCNTLMFLLLKTLLNSKCSVVLSHLAMLNA